MNTKLIAGYILLRRIMKHTEGAASGLLHVVKHDLIDEMNSAELIAAINLNIMLDLEREPEPEEEIA